MTETTTSYLNTALVKVTSVGNQDAKNYEVSAAAAGAFTLSYFLSSLAGCTSGYLNSGLALLFAGIAVHQFGMDNTYKLAATAGHQVSTLATAQYHSMFASKTEDQPKPATSKKVVDVVDPLGANKEKSPDSDVATPKARLR